MRVNTIRPQPLREVSPIFSLRLAPDWEKIVTVRSFVEDVVLRAFGAPQAARVGLVVHELLENAMKYGLMTRDVEIEIRASTTGRHFVVQVTNSAAVARSELLRKEVQRLREAPTDQVYAAAMSRIANDGSGMLGIGLSRLQHEARVVMSVEILGDRVTVTAASV